MRGLTQLQVATKANVTERMYQYYEAGERTPLATTAIDIAKALCTTVEELFEAAPDTTNLSKI